MNEACETEECFNILNAVVVDLKKDFVIKKNCKANAEEDNIRISTNLVKKEDQPCASITVGPKGIKEKEISRNKKHRLKSWTESMKKPKEGTSNNQTKEIEVLKVVY